MKNNNKLTGDYSLLEKYAVSFYPLSKYGGANSIDKMNAQDLAMDTFLKAYTEWNSKNKPSKKWYYTVMKNIFLDYKKNDLISYYGDLSTVSFSDYTMDFILIYDKPFEFYELSDETTSTLKKLPDNQRLCFIDYAINDLTIEQISRHRNISISSVKANLARAKKTLKKIFKV